MVPSPTPERSSAQPPQRPPAWDGAWETEWDRRDAHQHDLAPVRVVRIDKGGISVAPKSGTELLVVAAKAVRRVVVGDVCGCDIEAGRIESILERRTVFERRAPGAERDTVAVTSKAIAANMDVVLVLHGLDVGVNPGRLAREMVLAWESGARPVVVLTKTDLCTSTEVADRRALAQCFAPGVPVVAVSSKAAPTERAGEAESADTVALSDTTELDAHLPPGTVAALLGASGTGKSSLANALAGHPVQLTGEVREGDQRGRHTTTAGQMLPLTEDRWLIDTPGIRGVGLWHADDGLEKAFADLSPYAQRCRFDDCTHDAEPGCGIVEAVESGDLPAERLEVWHQLLAEVEQLEAQSEELDREAEREANQRSRRKAANRRSR
ncbi:MAG: ribosome small subunit-dependent GTPase A [Microthrixaceae bacterium]